MKLPFSMILIALSTVFKKVSKENCLTHKIVENYYLSK
jgi:hypothetical protein